MQKKDINFLFSNFKGNELNKAEFYRLLNGIDSELKYEQTSLLFNNFDMDGDGTVDLEEFRQRLELLDDTNVKDFFEILNKLFLKMKLLKKLNC